MWRLRRSVKRRIFVFLVLAAAGIGIFLIGDLSAAYRIRKKYEVLLLERDSLINSAKRCAYVTVREVKAGESFTAENTERRYLLSEQAQEGLAEEVFGLAACADLPAGSIINTALCGPQECSGTERECVFDDIMLSDCFADYEMVDVRLRYPNGENYCVLKKKRMRRNGENAEECRFALTEAEQILVSAAQYDTEVYKGAELYVVAFVEERLQKEADSFYVPPRQVILQLQRLETKELEVSAQWYGIREALEERLLQNREQRLENNFY